MIPDRHRWYSVDDADERAKYQLMNKSRDQDNRQGRS